MSFKLDLLKKEPLKGEIVKQVSGAGVELTLAVTHDDGLNSAFAKVQQLIDEQAKSVDFDSLKRSAQNKIDANQALLYVIGEYCVRDWNVTDTDGVPLPANGDNLIALLEHGFAPDDLLTFITDLINAFTGACQEFAELVANTKKKR